LPGGSGPVRSAGGLAAAGGRAIQRTRKRTRQINPQPRGTGTNATIAANTRLLYRAS
jgi:hypothetical protein